MNTKDLELIGKALIDDVNNFQREKVVLIRPETVAVLQRITQAMAEGRQLNELEIGECKKLFKGIFADYTKKDQLINELKMISEYFRQQGIGGKESIDQFGVSNDVVESLSKILSLRAYKFLSNLDHIDLDNPLSLLIANQDINKYYEMIVRLGEVGLFEKLTGKVKSVKSQVDQQMSEFMNKCIRGDNVNAPHPLGKYFQCNLTNGQVAALLLLSRESVRDNKYSEEEKRFLMKILKESVGDLKFNKNLRAIFNQETSPFGIKSEVVNNLCRLTFKTRNISKAEEVIAKAENAWGSKMMGAPHDKNKISLSDFAILHDLASIKETLGGLDPSHEVFSGDKALIKLYATVNKADHIERDIERTFEAEAELPAGAIIFDHTRDKAAVLGRTLDFFTKVQKNVTEFGHVSMVSDSEPENKQVVHINPEYKKEKLGLLAYLYSDAYVIKLEALISPENQKILKAKLGDDWLQILNSEFQKIQREIHDQGYLRNVGASSEKEQISVGLKSVFGLNRISGKGIGFEAVRNMVFSKDIADRSEMLCSEMVATLLVASLTELNLRVSRMHLPSNLVKIPITEGVNLHSLHPEALLKEMQKFNCVERMDKPAAIKQSIDFPRYKQ